MGILREFWAPYVRLKASARVTAAGFFQATARQALVQVFTGPVAHFPKSAADTWDCTPI